MSEIAVPVAADLDLSSLRLSAPAQTNRSEWTGTRKIVGLPGAELWRGTAGLSDIVTEEEERAWRAFLFLLQSSVNWFRWPLPCNQHPGGKPRVAAGAGDGYELQLEQMASDALILKAGAFLTIPLPSGHHRAVCLVYDLSTGSAGTATAYFRPALGEAPIAGTVVESVDPFIPMSIPDTELGFALANGLSNTSFETEEAR